MTQNTKIDGRSSDENARASLLLRVNNAVVSSLNLSELIDAISACLADVVAHDFAVLYLHDPAVDLLKAHALNTQRQAKIFDFRKLIDRHMPRRG